MEVKDNNTAMLSNYEVFQLLTDLKDQRKEDNNSGKNNKRSAAGQQNLDAITSETLRYLSQTPCGRQGPDTVKEFLITMTPHKLTKAETLQLLNLSPRTAVEIHLIVQECGERLCEEQIDELIQTVSGILPGDPQKDAPDGS